MTQSTAIYSDLTVAQNMHYFATILGVPAKQIAAEIDHLLQTVNLQQQQDHMVVNLSGGQKQCLSLAIALIGQPRLLVLDEPTVGLDPVLRQKLWRLFKKLAASGTTLIVSSHVMDEAEHCDQLLLMRDGGLLAQGSPRQLCQQTGTASVEQSFIQLIGDRT